MDANFQAAVRELSDNLIKQYFGSSVINNIEILQKKVFVAFLKRLEETPSWDSAPRFDDASRHILGYIVESIGNDSTALSKLGEFKDVFNNSSLALYRKLRKQCTSGQDNLSAAKDVLGQTISIYEHIRGDLGISVRRGDVAEGGHGRSVGGNVSRIVMALRDGRLIGAVGKAMQE